MCMDYEDLSFWFRQNDETPVSFFNKVYEIECCHSADENNLINLYIFEISTIRATRQYPFYIYSGEKNFFGGINSYFYIIKFLSFLKLMQERRN